MDRSKRKRAPSAKALEAEEQASKRQATGADAAAAAAESDVSAREQDFPPLSLSSSAAAEDNNMSDAPAGASAAAWPPVGLSVLVAATQPVHTQQSERRKQSNWSIEEDSELLSLANKFERSWNMVLARSALLARHGRTQDACKQRYAALRKSFASRKQRGEEQRAALESQGLQPNEVGPQSDDPGEGLHQVRGWNALAPIDRSEK
jgi:hypothetical protein